MPHERSDGEFDRAADGPGTGGGSVAPSATSVALSQEAAVRELVNFAWGNPGHERVLVRHRLHVQGRRECGEKMAENYLAYIEHLGFPNKGDRERQSLVLGSALVALQMAKEGLAKEIKRDVTREDISAHLDRLRQALQAGADAGNVRGRFDRIDGFMLDAGVHDLQASAEILEYALGKPIPTIPVDEES